MLVTILVKKEILYSFQITRFRNKFISPFIPATLIVRYPVSYVRDISFWCCTVCIVLLHITRFRNKFISPFIPATLIVRYPVSYVRRNWTGAVLFV